MPNYARCPECNASLPQAADWCSLCLTDLRPEPEPAPVMTPAAPTADLSVAAGAPAPAQPSPVAGSGRHRRTPTAAPRAGSRHATASSGSDLREEVESLVADAPVGADGKPNLDVLTDQLMARLVTSERRAAVPDIEALPGGKWGVLVGGMVAVSVLLVAIFAVLGRFFGA